MVSSAGDNVVIVYTDGACFGNPGPCSAAASLRFGGRVLYVSEYLGVGTNNIGELTAVKIALQSMRRRDVPVKIHSDSTYVIGVLSKNWKAKENLELIAEIKKLMTLFQKITFIKVPAHSGVPDNEMVDQMAKDAISRRKGTRELVGPSSTT